MTTNGQVNVTVQDGALGNVNVPAANSQAKIGCSSAGIAVGSPGAVVLSTTSKAAVIAAFGYGPMPEAAALIIDAGGTALCVKTPSNTAGSQGAVTHVGTGTSVVTTTGNAFDDADVVVKVVTSGTRGTPGAQFTISVDDSRNVGPVLNLGAALTYAIPNTGITLAFGAGSLVAGDTYTFHATAPLWNDAGVQAAILLLQSGGYSWGAGTHIVGPATGADATALQGYLDTLAGAFSYTYAFIDTADNGASSEATWIAALESDFGTVSAVRVCAGAGYVNINSPIPNPTVGTPAYRRPITWSAARRAVQVAPYVHLGRVKDGALGVTSYGSASDGLLYHDERITPGLDSNRFMTAMSRVRRPGVFIRNPNMMAPPGSDFTILPFRAVMDVACGITHDVLENYINDTVRLDKTTGFILEADALAIEKAGNLALATFLTNKGFCSSATMTVSRTDVIQTTKTITASVRVLALGYILELDVIVAFANPALGT